jgi:hypothetical protein
LAATFVSGDVAAGALTGGCSADLAKGLAAVESVPTDRRVAPALEALGQGCADLLGPLAEAALQASAMGRERRAEVLAQAAVSELPSDCWVDTGLAPARVVAVRCPLPLGEVVAPALLRHLDSGTYLFYLAVYQRLKEAAALDFQTLRILDNLLLAAALEGEAADLQGSR